MFLLFEGHSLGYVVVITLCCLLCCVEASRCGLVGIHSFLQSKKGQSTVPALTMFSACVVASRLCPVLFLRCKSERLLSCPCVIIYLHDVCITR